MCHFLLRNVKIRHFCRENLNIRVRRKDSGSTQDRRKSHKFCCPDLQIFAQYENITWPGTKYDIPHIFRHIWHICITMAYICHIKISHLTRQTSCICDPARKTFSPLPTIRENASLTEKFYALQWKKSAHLCLGIERPYCGGLLIVRNLHGGLWNWLWNPLWIVKATLALG